MEKRSIGNNVDARIDGEVLTLTINLKKELGPSRSGKTKLIATTNGNAILPDGSRIGVNVYRASR